MSGKSIEISIATIFLRLKWGKDKHLETIEMPLNKGRREVNVNSFEKQQCFWRRFSGVFSSFRLILTEMENFSNDFSMTFFKYFWRSLERIKRLLLEEMRKLITRNEDGLKREKQLKHDKKIKSKWQNFQFASFLSSAFDVKENLFLENLRIRALFLCMCMCVCVFIDF